MDTPPSEYGVSIHVRHDGVKRVLSLMTYGYDNLKDAKKAVVERLRDDGIDGDGGVVKSIDVREYCISIITSTCDIIITDMHIEGAVKKNGYWHTC